MKKRCDLNMFHCQVSSDLGHFPISFSLGFSEVKCFFIPVTVLKMHASCHLKYLSLNLESSNSIVLEYLIVEAATQRNMLWGEIASHRYTCAPSIGCRQ